MSWENVVKVNMHCLCLPGNLPCCIPLPGKQDKIWIFFFFLLLQILMGEQQWCIVACSAHTVQSRAYSTYNGYICMWAMPFAYCNVLSACVWALHTHTESDNKCCHRSWLVANGEFPTRLGRLCSIMKQSLNGSTGCLQVGLSACGVFKINRRRRRRRRGGHIPVNVSGFGWIKWSLNYMVCLLCGINSKRKNCAWHLRTNTT